MDEVRAATTWPIIRENIAREAKLMTDEAFKRGMKGVYQHCAHNHLHRYLAEFDSATATGRRLAWKMRSGPTNC